MLSKIFKSIHACAVSPLFLLASFAAFLGFGILVGADKVMRPNAIAVHVPAVVVHAILCEVVPFGVALWLIFRWAIVTSAELGIFRTRSLKTGHEACPSSYPLALAHVASLVTASIGLTTLLSAASLLGGYFLASIFDVVPQGLDLWTIVRAIHPKPLLIGLGKAAFFGALIALISTLCIIRARPVLQAIPGLAARSAGFCLVGCLVVNGLITAAQLG